MAHFADIPIGAMVLNAGCEAGLDTLIAADDVGMNGRVGGIDFSGAVIAQAHSSAK